MSKSVGRNDEHVSNQKTNELLQGLTLGKRDILNSIRYSTLVNIYGKVKEIKGIQIKAIMPASCIGDLCEIKATDSNKSILAEVVGFDRDYTMLTSLNTPDGVGVDAYIRPMGCKHKIDIRKIAYSEVYDGMGRKMRSDGRDLISAQPGAPEFGEKAVISEAVSATEKTRITESLPTGIRAIDGLLTLGEGQRVGLFAGAGCGKTTLLASLARGCSANSIVFALIGERGRELGEFLEHELDDNLKAKSIIVCATSDKSSMERARAAFTATAIAEGLRDQGQKVLLLVDSLTRFARAQREIGLANGEPPAKGGFPPSVYSMLPKLIERSGKTGKGSITAIYTILLEGDSMADPIADEAKSLLDGHIVLERKLAEKGHYPAINVLRSLSRIMPNVVEGTHIQKANQVRNYLGQLEEMELLIRLGEYQKGNDPVLDEAIEKRPEIDAFLKQSPREINTFKQAYDRLGQLSSMR